MAIEIQERDIQLLKFVFACRAVTYDQIARRHFAGLTTDVANRRIRKLVDANYLKHSFVSREKRAVRVVLPNSTSWPLIESHWHFKIENPLYKSESIEHDIKATEVFMRLEKLKSFCSYYPENLLQSSRTLAEDPKYQDACSLFSDGLMVVKQPRGIEQVFAIEYEFSKKSLLLYKQKIFKYSLAHGLSGVLYISPKQEVETLLSQAVSEICKDRRSTVYFATEENVFLNKSSITFGNFQGETLILE